MRPAQTTTLASTLLVAVMLSFSSRATAAPVTVLSNQTGFERSTDAITVPIPNAGIAFPGGTPCGEPAGVAGMGSSFSSVFGSNAVTISNPSTGALCIFNQGAVISPTNTNPNVMIGNTVVGNGEDDFLLEFTQPVDALGLRLLTNNVANEQLTFFGTAGNVIDTINIDRLTDPNTRQFVGFRSTVSFQSVHIDTAGGAVQNEGFDLLQVGSRVVPEPSGILLLGTGIIALGAYRYVIRRVV